MSEAEEIPHWHCNKRWTDVDKTRRALAVLESTRFEKKTWNVSRQSFYAILLNKNGLSESANPRSARAIFGTFKFFGFAWTKDRNLLVTPAGKAFIHNNVSDVLKLQLLKWQFPNPYQGKGIVAPYTRSLKLFPFRVVLRLLSDIGRLFEDELALFVWKMKNDSEQELSQVKRHIKEYRKLGDDEKEERCSADPLFTTDHEYEAHLRPYVIATGLCSFDNKRRFLRIRPEAKKEVRLVLSEEVEIRTDWKDEDEWFTYFGSTKYRYPPRTVEFRLSSQVGIARGFYVKIVQDERETYGLTDDSGRTNLSIFDDRQFRIEVMRPSDGKVVFSGLGETKPGDRQVSVLIREGLPPRIRSVDELVDSVDQLISADLDNEIKSRLQMRKRITQEEVSRRFLRHLRGARFEQLVFELLLLFEKRVFDHVVWNGRIGEWGLPLPAQKISKETGKKLPDIVAFEGDNVYVIETTLLRGRAQWEKPEAVSVPDHIEDMIRIHKPKKVHGLFIAQELDPSAVTNLILRAVNRGYELVPMEISTFVDIVHLLDKNASRDFWRSHYSHLWKIHRRTVVRKES